MITTKQLKAPKKIKESKTKAYSPLIIEPHSEDYIGVPFVTLVQYHKQPILGIIDNVSEDDIRIFSLDLCKPEHINEEIILSIASEWYEHRKHEIPISIEFSRRGLTSITSKLYRVLNIEYVSRIIGPFPKYPMVSIKSVKRRRRKQIPLELIASGRN